MTTLTINDSTVPVLRAGSSNVVWPIVGIAVFMLFKAAELPGNEQWIVRIFMLITIALGIRLFITTAARVTFLDDTVEVLMAVGSRRLRYDQIESVELVRMRLTPLLRMRLKPKGSRGRLQLSVKGPITAWGTLAECSTKLRKQFEGKGIIVVEK